MSSDERLRNLGRLQEAEQAARLLVIKIDALKRSVREQTSPHRPIEELDPSRLRAAVDELVELEGRYRRTIEEIVALREDLGLPRYEVR